MATVVRSRPGLGPAGRTRACAARRAATSDRRCPLRLGVPADRRRGRPDTPWRRYPGGRAGQLSRSVRLPASARAWLLGSAWQRRSARPPLARQLRPDFEPRARPRRRYGYRAARSARYLSRYDRRAPPIGRAGLIADAIGET